METTDDLVSPNSELPPLESTIKDISSVASSRNLFDNRAPTNDRLPPLPVGEKLRRPRKIPRKERHSRDTYDVRGTSSLFGSDE
jgi:hypothetical protein